MSGLCGQGNPNPKVCVGGWEKGCEWEVVGVCGCDVMYAFF